ncbi:AAA family ATPase [Micromonospora globispora]|nr:AAA family ATPase [Micromonospora globispora]
MLDTPWLDEQGQPFTPSARRAEVEAETPDLFHSGGAFVLDIPETPPAVWGDGDHVIWAEGEALMIAAPQGVGKTTVALQLVRARLGLQDRVLGYSVAHTGGRVLYLAMDRPAQVQRAAHRLFSAQDRALLDERLVIWKGPPPYDMAQRRDILAVMAQKAKADTVIVDSIKDAALGISEDAVGAGYNRARQQALTEGVQILELHHTVKKGTNGAAPDDLAGVYGSTWLTSGAGSVVSLWGEAGDPVVMWRHLKQPSQEVGPFRVVHNHETGTSEVEQNVDIFALVRRTGVQGLTALEFAVALFERPNPTRAQKEKARRRLEKKVEGGYLSRVDGAAGSSAARYYLARPDVHGEVHAP